MAAVASSWDDNLVIVVLLVRTRDDLLTQNTKPLSGTSVDFYLFLGSIESMTL